MDEKTKPIGKDATGYEVMTEAMKVLLNQFPGLEEEEKVKFEELGKDEGIAFANNAGALVYTEKEDIIGGVHQTCKYSFFLVYRTPSSDRQQNKMSILEFLDAFGKWLCMEIAVIEGERYRLLEYPVLSGGRKIKKITRDNSYGTEPQENGVQDWVLPVTVEYTNEFYR